jgi:hypothetical protein
MEYHVGFNNHTVAQLEQFLIDHGFLVSRTSIDNEGTGMLYATNQATTTDSLSVDHSAVSRSSLAGHAT